jgi:hypothetical protein
MSKTVSQVAALWLFAIVMTCTQSAWAVVIDFESAPIGTDQTSIYLEEGFRLTTIVGDYDIYASDSFIGDGQYLALERTNSGTEQSRVRIDMFGALFNFESLLSSSFGGRITFSDGATELFGDFISEPVTVAFSGHTNLSWIELSSRSNDYLRVDNINLSVPEPRLLFITSLGLVCLASVRFGKHA